MDKAKVEVRLKGKDMPRNAKGDVEFLSLREGDSHTTITSVFNDEEIVTLVNRAIYQLEYQRESHRKRGLEERARHKALREALKAQGKSAKDERIARELKGERG